MELSNINNLRDLRQAKSHYRSKMQKEEVLIRTNLELFKTRWNDSRIGGALRYKGTIMDGFSLALDAVYVFKGGIRDKTQLAVRAGEVAMSYLTEKYSGRLLSVLKNLIPKRSRKSPENEVNSEE